MDDFWTFLQGFAVGLSVAIPVGPLALLCMRRTLDRGFSHGFTTGLGAAVADGIYSFGAAFGIAAIAEWLARNQAEIRLSGAVALAWFAFHTWRHDPLPPVIEARARRLPGDFASGFILAFTNPMTMIGFAAIFATFGLGAGLAGVDGAMALVAGTFAGSASWWLALSLGVARVRHLISARTLRTINLVAALVLAGSCLYALVSAILILTG